MRSFPLALISSSKRPASADAAAPCPDFAFAPSLWLPQAASIMAARASNRNVTVLLFIAHNPLNVKYHSMPSYESDDCSDDITVLGGKQYFFRIIPIY